MQFKHYYLIKYFYRVPNIQCVTSNSAQLHSELVLVVHKMSIVFDFIVFDFQPQQVMNRDNKIALVVGRFLQSVYNLYCLPFVRAYNVLQWPIFKILSYHSQTIWVSLRLLQNFIEMGVQPIGYAKCHMGRRGHILMEKECSCYRR